MLTKLDVCLTPVVSDRVPVVDISVPGKTQRHELHQSKTIALEFESTTGWLEIRFDNKPEFDVNMAVIIDRVEFFGISDPRFVWAGVYTPRYPEPWYSQQETKPPVCIPQQNYLGWNGAWRLEFDIPVFTWMHRTMNLGWLYQ